MLLRMSHHVGLGTHARRRDGSMGTIFEGVPLHNMQSLCYSEYRYLTGGPVLEHSPGHRLDRAWVTLQSVRPPWPRLPRQACKRN